MSTSTFILIYLEQFLRPEYLEERKFISNSFVNAGYENRKVSEVLKVETE